MTIASVFSTPNQPKKPIVLLYKLQSHAKATKAETDPCRYDEVMLLGLMEFMGLHYDLIVAWDDHAPDSKHLYLGYWNDGIVNEEE